MVRLRHRCGQRDREADLRPAVEAAVRGGVDRGGGDLSGGGKGRHGVTEGLPAQLAGDAADGAVQRLGGGVLGGAARCDGRRGGQGQVQRPVVPVVGTPGDDARGALDALDQSRRVQPKLLAVGNDEVFEAEVAARWDQVFVGDGLAANPEGHAGAGRIALASGVEHELAAAQAGDAARCGGVEARGCRVVGQRGRAQGR